MTKVYRLCSLRFKPNSGAGAAKYGGRWNRIGSEAIYAAASASLAALEILVHYSVLPRDFGLTEISIPPQVSIQRLDASSLPNLWDSEVPISATQDIGQRWLQEGVHAVLSVPSSIMPPEPIYVINPNHPEFAKIAFGTHVPFQFDPRLK